MLYAKIVLLGLIVGTSAAPTKHDHVTASAMSKKESFARSEAGCGKFKSLGAIVHLNEKKVKDPHAFKAYITALGNHGDVVNFVYTTLSHGFAGKFSDKTMEHLFAHPHVERIDADCEMKLIDPIGAAEMGSMAKPTPALAHAIDRASKHGVKTLTTQDNPWWGLDRIDQSTEDTEDGSYDYGDLNGRNSLIYVLDTGVRTDHEDFGGRAEAGWSAGCPDAGSPTAACSSGWVAQGVITEASSSCHLHGTHCASTAGGTTYGVAKGATIITVQVLSCQGSGSNSGVNAGMEWAVNDAKNRGKPAVLSMSLGGPGGGSQNDIIQRITDEGVVVSVAAGNENSDACNFSPASAPAALSVMAADVSEGLASFSNYGPCTDIIAPGVAIKAAASASTTATTTISGTSMACPHVSGVVAQLRTQYPDMSAQAIIDAVLCLSTPDQIQFGSGQNPSGSPNKLLYTGTSIYTSGKAQSCGLSDQPWPPSAPPHPPFSPPPPKSPPPPSNPPGVCSNDCQYNNDNDCDDGGPDSDFSLCELGTDCADCGNRATDPDEPDDPSPAPSAPPPVQAPAESPINDADALCGNSCYHDHDGDCDDGGPDSDYSACDIGTDCGDCGPRAPPPPATPGCSNECFYDFDGDCDDGGAGSDYSSCDYGSDCGDCGPRNAKRQLKAKQQGQLQAAGVDPPPSNGNGCQKKVGCDGISAIGPEAAMQQIVAKRKAHALKRAQAFHQKGKTMKAKKIGDEIRNERHAHKRRMTKQAAQAKKK